MNEISNYLYSLWPIVIGVLLMLLVKSAKLRTSKIRISTSMSPMTEFRLPHVPEDALDTVASYLEFDRSLLSRCAVGKDLPKIYAKTNMGTNEWNGYISNTDDLPFSLFEKLKKDTYTIKGLSYQNGIHENWFEMSGIIDKRSVPDICQALMELKKERIGVFGLSGDAFLKLLYHSGSLSGILLAYAAQNKLDVIGVNYGFDIK